MDFHTYIHAVGTGHKGNRDLTFDESADMMQQILEQNVHSEQIAAFLLGWRIKPETTQEFRGALSSCDLNMITTPVENSIELGYPFDGKVNNPYLFPLIAKILNSHLNLVVSGDELLPAKDGITVKDICTHININQNLHYFDRKKYCNKLHKLTKIRVRLGLRTGLSTIEKLPHVGRSEYGVTGVFHKPYVQKYIDIFSSRYKRLALLKGNEGTPELFSKGRLWIAQDANVTEHIIEPEYYGVNYKRSWENITLEESLHQINNPSDELMKLAILNAAILLFIAEKAESINEGVERLNG
ncbi:MAG: glycosyl transferase [Campylobacterota bacterium]|nr:glycosyl transferase [Campylobacterota bacterium]